MPEAEPNQPAAPKKTPILKILLIAVVLVIGGLAAVVAMQPDEFRIVRSATIAAPPEIVFAQVDDFHNWEAWSPWAKLDPAAKNTFEGPAKGEGAIFSWDGNDQVGAGRMTVIESKPPESIKIKLEFSRPMQPPSLTEFTFEPKGSKTLLTWTMSGQQTFVGKGICMLMNMDKLVGGMFEEGLANLRTVAEKTK